MYMCVCGCMYVCVSTTVCHRHSQQSLRMWCRGRLMKVLNNIGGGRLVMMQDGVFVTHTQTRIFDEQI